jgi:SAM-dependent methyltransferase
MTPLTDIAALTRNRARARDGSLFLHDMAAESLKDRLAMVNRVFTATTLVSGYPDLWVRHFPDAQQVADTEELPIPPQSCDLVIHALALHWANDPVGQLIQMRRGLRPDGLMIAVLFGGTSLSELRTALAEAESAVTGGLSPRVAPMAEIRDLGGLMQRAGFALPVADAERLAVEYADLPSMMRELRHMGEANAMAARLRRPTGRRLLRVAEDVYRTHFGTAEGRLPATVEMIFLTGWAPGPGQQQPLRPGSAIQRLADALGTTETGVKD